MFDLGPALEHATVAPGTNLLVSGPPLSGKRRVAIEVLAVGSQEGEGAIVVTTRDDARQVLRHFRSQSDDLARGPVEIVDCVTKQQGRPTAESPNVAYVDSPDDMTAIGIQFSELLEEFAVERGIDRTRVTLDSLTTLLMYSDAETVFQFLHVFTDRIDNAGALGLFLIESRAHDPEIRNTLSQLFDGIITTTPDDTPTLDLSPSDEDVNS
ncbi:MAG: RAD55 family ATPase [Salinirussus sp.]